MYLLICLKVDIIRIKSKNNIKESLLSRTISKALILYSEDATNVQFISLIKWDSNGALNLNSFYNDEMFANFLFVSPIWRQASTCTLF
jgi:hypothetical protein